MAFDPPPMQATKLSGSRPLRSSICSRASLPIIDWKSRTMAGIGMRPGDRADDVEGVVHVGDPVAQGFVHRILERAASAR